MGKRKKRKHHKNLLTWIISSVISMIIFNLINRTGQSTGEIVFVSCYMGGLVTILAFFFRMIKIGIQEKKAIQNKKCIDKAKGVTKYYSFIHVGGLPARQNVWCDVILSPTDLKVECGEQEFTLQFEKISKVDFKVCVTTERYQKSSMVKGMVGAAAFGMPGAILGSMPKTKTRVKKGECLVMICYESIPGRKKDIFFTDDFFSGDSSAFVNLLRARIDAQVNH